MLVCNDCGTTLKELFGTKMYCPNDCDRVEHGASSDGDKKPKTTTHRCLDDSSGDAEAWITMYGIKMKGNALALGPGASREFYANKPHAHFPSAPEWGKPSGGWKQVLSADGTKVTIHNTSGDIIVLSTLISNASVINNIAHGNFSSGSIAQECIILVREIVKGNDLAKNRNRLAVALARTCNDVEVDAQGKIEINLRRGFATKDLPKAVSHGASKITVDTKYVGRKILKDVSRSSGVRPIFT